MAKMTEQELVQVIASEEAEAYGAQTGELAIQRADALDRYHCLPYGDEVDGRSGAVSSDLRDTVEQVVPQLLKVFLSGDEIVKFTPTGKKDEQQADQETDYCNFVMMQRNNGFGVLSTWFRDALLQKNGYVKVWWEQKSDVKLEEYQGLSDMQLAGLIHDEGVTVTAHTAYPDPNPPPPPQQPPQQPQMGPDGPFVIHPPPPPPPPQMHDVSVRRTKAIEFVRVENVPPEEVLVGKNTRTVMMQDAAFVQHRTPKTLSELRQMGYEVDDEDGMYSGDDADESMQRAARNLYQEEQFGEDDNSLDPAMRRAVFKENYMLVDFDGDGIAELRKVCTVGNKVLANEETDHIPFACVTPIIAPHRHIGVSFYDLLKYQQRYKTVAMRNTFDNAYLATNGRYAADVNKVNIDDMLVSRPGGIVRTDGPPGDALFPLTHPSNGQGGLELIQYIDSWSEKSSGISAYGGNYQGVDQNALNKTATGVNQAQSFQQLKVEAVARTFAETGIRDLFLLIQQLSIKHATKPEIVKLRNEWQEIDPRSWVKRYDMTISVGIGTADKDKQAMGLTTILQMQQQGMGLGLANPHTIYNALCKFASTQGYKNPEDFFVDPGPNMPPPPPNPIVQAEQIKAQAHGQVEGQKMQLNAQIEQMKNKSKFDAEMAHAQAQGQIEQARMQADMAVKQQAAQSDYELQIAKARMQLELEAMKHSQAQETAITIARINAGAKVEAAGVQGGAEDGDKFVDAQGAQSGTPDVASKPDPHTEAMQQMTQHMQALHAALTAPKEIVRGPDGRAIGTRTLQ